MRGPESQAAELGARNIGQGLANYNWEANLTLCLLRQQNFTGMWPQLLIYCLWLLLHDNGRVKLLL